MQLLWDVKLREWAQLSLNDRQSNGSAVIAQNCSFRREEKMVGTSSTFMNVSGIIIHSITALALFITCGHFSARTVASAFMGHEHCERLSLDVTSSDAVFKNFTNFSHTQWFSLWVGALRTTSESTTIQLYGNYERTQTRDDSCDVKLFLSHSLSSSSSNRFRKRGERGWNGLENCSNRTHVNRWREKDCSRRWVMKRTKII